MPEILKADEADHDNPPYYRVGLVGCGAQKRDEACMVREMYTSNYFALKREWAENYCYRWLIVSAEYAVVHPEDEIKPYETDLRELSEKTREMWTDLVTKDLRFHLSTVGGTPHSHEVVLLMGGTYREHVREALRRLPYGYEEEDEHADVYSPFEEVEEARGGNGSQMGWLKDEVERAENGHVGQTDVEAWSG